MDPELKTRVELTHNRVHLMMKRIRAQLAQEGNTMMDQGPIPGYYKSLVLMDVALSRYVTQCFSQITESI